MKHKGIGSFSFIKIFKLNVSMLANVIQENIKIENLQMEKNVHLNWHDFFQLNELLIDGSR